MLRSLWPPWPRRLAGRPEPTSFSAERDFRKRFLPHESFVFSLSLIDFYCFPLRENKIATTPGNDLVAPFHFSFCKLGDNSKSC